MSDFTRDEAKGAAGDVRAIILWEIALRCGKAPDLHPRLLEGIEAAARRIATPGALEAERRLQWYRPTGSEVRRSADSAALVDEEER